MSKYSSSTPGILPLVCTAATATPPLTLCGYHRKLTLSYVYL